MLRGLTMGTIFVHDNAGYGSLRSIRLTEGGSSCLARCGGALREIAASFLLDFKVVVCAHGTVSLDNARSLLKWIIRFKYRTSDFEFTTKICLLVDHLQLR